MRSNKQDKQPPLFHSLRGCLRFYQNLRAETARTFGVKKSNKSMTLTPYLYPQHVFLRPLENSTVILLLFYSSSHPSPLLSATHASRHTHTRTLSLHTHTHTHTQEPPPPRLIATPFASCDLLGFFSFAYFLPLMYLGLLVPCMRALVSHVSALPFTMCVIFLSFFSLPPRLQTRLPLCLSHTHNTLPSFLSEPTL